jgi:hypothetical protein
MKAEHPELVRWYTLKYGPRSLIFFLMELLFLPFFSFAYRFCWIPDSPPGWTCYPSNLKAISLQPHTAQPPCADMQQRRTVPTTEPQQGVDYLNYSSKSSRVPATMSGMICSEDGKRQWCRRKHRRRRRRRWYVLRWNMKRRRRK